MLIGSIKAAELMGRQRYRGGFSRFPKQEEEKDRERYFWARIWRKKQEYYVDLGSFRTSGSLCHWMNSNVE